LSPRGASHDAAASDVATDDQAVTQAITDADFDAAAWRGAGRALQPIGLRRVVVRELSQADGSADTMAVRAVIAPPSRTDHLALQRLHERGVRGLRFRLDAACDADMILSWAERVCALRWHVEVELPAASDTLRLTDAEWPLLQVPVPTCFSGLAGFVAAHEAEAAFLLELVEMGRFWLKLSGTEIAGAKPPARDALRQLIDAAMTVRADRLVWGSGPSSPRQDFRGHKDLQKHLDTAIDGLRQLLPDAANRSRVLWSNPAALYGF